MIASWERTWIRRMLWFLPFFFFFLKQNKTKNPSHCPVLCSLPFRMAGSQEMQTNHVWVMQLQGCFAKTKELFVAYKCSPTVIHLRTDHYPKQKQQRKPFRLKKINKSKLHNTWKLHYFYNNLTSRIICVSDRHCSPPSILIPYTQDPQAEHIFMVDFTQSIF